MYGLNSGLTPADLQAYLSSLGSISPGSYTYSQDEEEYYDEDIPVVDTAYGTKPKDSKFNSNSLEAALRLGKYISARRSNNKAHENLAATTRKAAEAAMPVMPTEIYSNFHLSGLAHAYQNAANNQRAMQFVGND
ncbi:MAG: hypothetical protein J6V44_12240 [Methanobrevibacter sp.]|nr:hypothetical protein [Methanobrevibacter sp.]